MANDVVNKKFTDPALNRYDVMQHIRNLYGIVGVTNTDSFEKNDAANIAALVDKIAERTIVEWSGTWEEYERDRAKGIIKDDTVCAIEDDFIDPYKK